MPTVRSKRRARARQLAARAAQALGLLLVAPMVLHFAIVAGTAMDPPAVAPVSDGSVILEQSPDLLRLGRSYSRLRGRIHEIRLAGTPEQIGHAHVQLAYDQVVAIERTMHEELARYVPWAPVRWALVDFARWRFRDLDLTLGDERRREIAAYAAAFAPDPFASGMDTYQRFVFLNSLYDIMLAFERSPLVGCSSVALTGEATGDGHVLLGRNFDFEGPQILDDQKAVFLIHEQGRVPYATVSWPGFIGAATGMNAAGVAVVVHGARAGQPRRDGSPVTLTVRAVLAAATSTSHAIEVIGMHRAMVSHLLLVADAQGEVVVIERAPGERDYVRRAEGTKVALTNHFEGPLQADPANQRVRAQSSTEPRRRRLDEILENLPSGASVERIVEILRDRRALGGEPLPLGHRGSIDALIATHSVAMDLTDRSIWVSEGPHTLGRYVRFDLKRLLDPSYAPTPEPVETLAEDELLSDGRYQAWRAQGSPRPGAE
ncbi:MAG: hypothetical protein JRI23_05685 [Deltaproteobacteria bacterium]|jgi:hypothetical protein|nr:hypothetical protein [Deltaproteobacteria bacterium]MBW2531053.1 hypothetical protein [Deltaproteobacteria bacterium]